MKKLENIKNTLGNMSDEHFEEFLQNFNDDKKAIFNQMRFWHKMQNNSEFCKQVESEIARATYREINEN